MDENPSLFVLYNTFWMIGPITQMGIIGVITFRCVYVHTINVVIMGLSTITWGYQMNE